MCRQLSILISEDKHLWLALLARVSQSLGNSPVPRFQSVEGATATHVESWLRAIWVLRRQYESGKAPLRAKAFAGLCVTWVKVVRSNWCLIATSDKSHSRIALWNAAEVHDLRLCAEVFLPGPVLDGQIDDSALIVRFAVSIGMR